MKSAQEIRERCNTEQTEYEETRESWNLGWADALRWVLDLPARKGAPYKGKAFDERVAEMCGYGKQQL